MHRAMHARSENLPRAKRRASLTVPLGLKVEALEGQNAAQQRVGVDERGLGQACLGTLATQPRVLRTARWRSSTKVTGSEWRAWLPESWVWPTVPSGLAWSPGRHASCVTKAKSRAAQLTGAGLVSCIPLFYAP